MSPSSPSSPSLTSALASVLIASVSASPTASASAVPLPDAESEERFSSLALCLVLVLLIGSFLVSYYLKVRKITAIHETIVGLFAGEWVDRAWSQRRLCGGNRQDGMVTMRWTGRPERESDHQGSRSCFIAASVSLLHLLFSILLIPGMIVGAALRVGPGQAVQQMLSFRNTIMLNVLLPPIILASGYDLRQVC